MGDTWRGKKRDDHRHGRHPRSGWAVQGHQAHALGRGMEDRVDVVLQRMLAGGLIQGFVRHRPGFPCKDFTITYGGAIKAVNVTTSAKAWKAHYERFGPGVEILHLHPAVTDQEIADRILSVFQVDGMQK